jgi:hypothetical protein
MTNRAPPFAPPSLSENGMSFGRAVISQTDDHELKSRGVSYRPRKTNQDMIVEAIKAYLAQAKE